LVPDNDVSVVVGVVAIGGVVDTLCRFEEIEASVEETPLKMASTVDKHFGKFGNGH